MPLHDDEMRKRREKREAQRKKQQDGAFRCSLKRIEVMGRDTSVVCAHPAFTGESFRAIVDSDDLPKLAGPAVRFALKPNKVFAFRKDTGSRIPL